MSLSIPRVTRPWAIGLIVAVVANLLIFSPVPLLLKTCALLLLAGLLPGALLVEMLIGRSAAPPPLAERILYSIGASYSSMVLIMLAISYLPGGASRLLTLFVFDAWLLALLALCYWRTNHFSAVNVNRDINADHSPLRLRLFAPLRLDVAKPGWLAVGLFSILLVGGFLRFTHLGYAEFQGDEARLALRAAEVIQGYENALFVHQKGPTEILLPTVVYALTGQLTETVARLPFTLANLTALFALFLLGWRLLGPAAGWAAALLLALDGYIIGFARVVQYQSIVLLMVILVVLIFYRLACQPKALTRYLVLAALLLATGLLSHYEAALVAFPVGYLLWRIWRGGVPLGRLARALVLPGLLGAVLIASFYLPFILKPSFANTFAYLTSYRMGGGGSMFNHLAEFFARTTVYSSTYYLLTLIGLAVIGLIQIYARNLTGGLRWLAATLIVAGMALTFRSANWLTLAGTDYTWLFFAALLISAWCLPKFPPAERVVWLWFGAPMVLALFFTAIPNTHVYGFFIGWMLVAGLVIQRGWQTLARFLSVPTAQRIAAPLAVAVILLFGTYEYWYFVYNRVEVLRTWPINRPRGYWVNYAMPVDVAIFGFPLNNGWKAVGELYAAGILEGNYTTNTRDVVAEWYTRGAHFCARDVPNYFMLANPVEPGLAAATAELRRQIQADHELFGTVRVQGRPALEIYQIGKNGITPQQFALENYAPHFDQQLTMPHFERNGPVGQPQIQQPLDLRFGAAIWLKGYRLDQPQAKVGASAALTLYWQATQRIEQDYFVFVQVIDMTDFHKAGQRDGQPSCNHHPTTTWLPGDMIADRYTIPIEPDAQPGEYTLLIGLYMGDQRLEVYTADGRPLGNQLALAKLQVDQ